MVRSGWPSDAPWILGTFVGASVLATGISRVMMSVRDRSLVSLPPAGGDPSATET